MSAYVVVELTVKNAEAKDRYSAAAAPILKEHGGEFIAGGAWTLLTRARLHQRRDHPLRGSGRRTALV